MLLKVTYQNFEIEDVEDVSEQPQKILDREGSDEFVKETCKKRGGS